MSDLEIRRSALQSDGDFFLPVPNLSPGFKQERREIRVLAGSSFTNVEDVANFLKRLRRGRR